MDTPDRRPKAVFAIVERKNGKDIWVRVGTAFHNRDTSINVYLDAVPINGKLQIREIPTEEHRSQGRNPDNPSRPLTRPLMAASE